MGISYKLYYYLYGNSNISFLVFNNCLYNFYNITINYSKDEIFNKNEIELTEIEKNIKIGFNIFYNDKYALEYCLKNSFINFYYSRCYYSINGINITSFYKCCEKGLIEIAKMIYNFIDINNYDLSNCFLVSCKYGKINIMKWLLTVNNSTCSNCMIVEDLLDEMEENIKNKEEFYESIKILCEINPKYIVIYCNFDNKYKINGYELFKSIINIDELYVDELCSICLISKQNIFLKNCKHTFCNICIYQYFIQHKKCVFTCSICRNDISYDKIRIFNNIK